jgi:hypothetical protein
MNNPEEFKMSISGFNAVNFNTGGIDRSNSNNGVNNANSTSGKVGANNGVNAASETGAAYKSTFVSSVGSPSKHQPVAIELNPASKSFKGEGVETFSALAKNINIEHAVPLDVLGIAKAV